MKHVTWRELKRLSLLGVLMFGRIAWADAPIDSNSLSAKLLMALPHYVELGTSSLAPPSLCVIGNPQLVQAVDTLNARTATFSAVYNFKFGDPHSCLFVYAATRVDARHTLQDPSLKNSLKISTYASFVDEGGAIAFIDESGRIQLSLNLSAASEINAHFKPDLIDISKRVIR